MASARSSTSHATSRTEPAGMTPALCSSRSSRGVRARTAAATRRDARLVGELADHRLAADLRRDGRRGSGLAGVAQDAQAARREQPRELARRGRDPHPSRARRPPCAASIPPAPQASPRGDTMAEQRIFELGDFPLAAGRRGAAEGPPRLHHAGRAERRARQRRPLPDLVHRRAGRHGGGDDRAGSRARPRALVHRHPEPLRRRRLLLAVEHRRRPSSGAASRASRRTTTCARSTAC